MNQYLDDDDAEFYIPKNIRRQIEKEYIQRTFYWSVGLGSFIIGILIGVAI
jgi:hypothetical protein